jgi:hypothetical protein
LAPNDFWLFPEIKYALKWQRLQDTEDIQKMWRWHTESYSTTGVQKMFPTVAASLCRVHSCSRGALQRWLLSVSCKYTGMFAIKLFWLLHTHIMYFTNMLNKEISLHAIYYESTMEVKECVELYLHSPICFHCMVLS